MLSISQAILFRINASERQTTVRLLSMEEDEIVERGAASLDGKIVEFGPSIHTSFSRTVRGIYQDCIKDATTTITELLIWDGKQLTAPLYDPSSNINSLSARESGLPCMDIDGDGEIEWPQSSRMPGYETTPTEQMQLWLTDWYAWDMEISMPVKKLTNIMNVSDGYYLEIPDDWRGQVTAHYEADERTLVLQYVDHGVLADEFAAFRVASSGASSKRGSFIFIASDGATRYEVWYDSDHVWKPTMEILRSIFKICTVK